MAPKTSWHRYGTKLRHCHPIYAYVPLFLHQRSASGFNLRRNSELRVNLTQICVGFVTQICGTAKLCILATLVYVLMRSVVSVRRCCNAMHDVISARSVTFLSHFSP